MSRGSNTVQAARRALRIIEAIQELNGASATEIAEYLDQSRSNVYKYVNTLEEERYVVKDGDNVYRVGLKTLNLGAAARQRRAIYETAKPQIEELATKSSETASLMVEEHGQGILLYRSDSHRPVDLDIHAGRETHLHATAMGKAILAHLPRRRVNEILDRYGLPRMTEKTIAHEDALFAELEEIRERGWASDDEERFNGLRCVGVAILDTEDRVLGAIGISGPSSRLTELRFTEEFPEMLLDVKNVIELNMAYN